MFTTQNFHLASALVAENFPIHTIDRSEPRNVKIAFDDSTELRDTVEHYWNGSLKISAIRHSQEYKTLMDRINY